MLLDFPICFYIFSVPHMLFFDMLCWFSCWFSLWLWRCCTSSSVNKLKSGESNNMFLTGSPQTSTDLTKKAAEPTIIIIVWWPQIPRICMCMYIFIWAEGPNSLKYRFQLSVSVFQCFFVVFDADFGFDFAVDSVESVHPHVSKKQESQTITFR